MYRRVRQKAAAFLLFSMILINCCALAIRIENDMMTINVAVSMRMTKMLPRPSLASLLQGSSGADTLREPSRAITCSLVTSSFLDHPGR
jgi:hypothetical protein